MRHALRAVVLSTAFAVISSFAPLASADRDNDRDDDRGRHHEVRDRHRGNPAQLGDRPFYLVDGMDEGRLKNRLMQCKAGPFYQTDFSIAHRGAALQFPEHTKESYEAGARQGAGIVECDVTFTKDGTLVCRHDECDLHTTTNIVATDLNDKCSVPWTGPVPANPAPRCCASDLSLAEFKTLTGKMDAANPAATTPQGYLGGTASWRTDLYTGRGTLLTLRESIELNEKLGAKHTPELKSGNPVRLAEVFGGQEQYAQAMIDEFKHAGVSPRRVWAQSFNPADVIYWVKNEPRFGRQAVYLDSINPPAVPRLSLEQLKALRKEGVQIFAPPMFALLDVAGDKVIPSQYARDIKSVGFDIIAWTFERSDLRRGAATAGFYYQFDPKGQAVKKDSDMYKALDVLAKDVRILGIFSDWPATVTYYANCMGLK
jgi:glycerophosphoryl diester phosphodiesterase